LPAHRDHNAALLAVDETGRGEPLVLIHGLATTREIWGIVVPALARERRVVTLDVPGFGASAPAGPGFDLALVAERIARGLAAHGVRGPFDLAGHSLGAGVALTLACARPTLVRRLILVAPAGVRPRGRLPASLLAPSIPTLFAARRRLAPLTDFGLGRRLLLSLAVADGSTISPTQARLMIEASNGASRIAAAFAAVASADLRPLLTQTVAPLGLIWGQRDLTVPARGAGEIRAARPDALLELIPEAGHVPMIERPEAFAAALAGLLERLPKHATTPRRRATNLR
jgi:pimeloyl-ACP methyl ester carboxylesterase